VAHYSSEALRRATQQLHDNQTLEEISQRLKYAYDTQSDVTIQLAVTDETGLTSELITGKINGYTDQNTVFVDGIEVSMEHINEVQIDA
jgi:hypothetical protein